MTSQNYFNRFCSKTHHSGISDQRETDTYRITIF